GHSGRDPAGRGRRLGARGVLLAGGAGALAAVLDRSVFGTRRCRRRRGRRRAVKLLALLACLVGLMPGVSSAQTLPGASLGGSPAAFEQLLGAANDGSIGALLHYQRCLGTDIDQFVLLAPNDQVWTIQRAFCDLSTMPAAQPLSDAAQFLPPDAVAGDTFTSELGETGMTYQSASLAGAPPAALFPDCAGAPVPLGTLFVVADAYGGWFMGPGSCP